MLGGHDRTPVWVTPVLVLVCNERSPHTILCGVHTLPLIHSPEKKIGSPSVRGRQEGRHRLHRRCSPGSCLLTFPAALLFVAPHDNKLTPALLSFQRVRDTSSRSFSFSFSVSLIPVKTDLRLPKRKYLQLQLLLPHPLRGPRPPRFPSRQRMPGPFCSLIRVFLTHD